MSYDLIAENKALSFCYWKVTRSLVSYDFNLCCNDRSFTLKGHQIIGELRLFSIFDGVVNTNWKVTRSLVSYDRTVFCNTFSIRIERSPDHWWVTTSNSQAKFCLRYWKVTRSLVSYDRAAPTTRAREDIERSPDHWWVTTKVVDFFLHLGVIERSPDHWWVTTWWDLRAFTAIKLKGHQIIGELRHLLSIL